MPWIVGYPRDKVSWYPIIDPQKCLKDKCAICMNCGQKVFEWTKDGPKVVNPNSCVVGCTTCGNLCRGTAISFPDKKELRLLYAKEKIWDKVHEQLEKDGKLKIVNHEQAAVPSQT
ncbi:MAG: ferredoxin family protein [Deltaproteobacteria bacterium]|nr:ferredoxin family protein [Deltaproteobacteria bacterium]MCL5792748.1 ferredoxin family protein [Deltaproteobacteria bacterium]